MKLLHIDSGILGTASVSRQLSAEAVAEWRARHPNTEVVYRDLVAQPLSHLAGDQLFAAGADPSQRSAEMNAILSESDKVLQEFLDADVVVIGAPMNNFGISSQLKAWIDRILVAGKTFKYSAQGVEGLVGNKRIIVAISRGGFYGAGTPAAVGEHLETYLRWVFGFIGVTNPEFISADGIQIGPEHREKALAGALQAATNLHAA